MATSELSDTAGRASGAARVADAATSLARGAKAGLDDAIEQVSSKAKEAVRHPGDAVTALDEAIRECARTRPYTTVAVAAFVGFLYARRHR